MAQKCYDAVIFDLDGTLIDSMWIWRSIDEAYLLRHGFTLPPELQKDIEGMSTTETAQYFKNRFGIADTLETIKAEWVEMARMYYDTRIPLKPGADAFLTLLAETGVKVGIGTSNFRDLTDIVLKRHQVMQHIHCIRTSCEVPRGKPFPDVFLQVAEDLGVPPEKCLVFEDTHAGVLAAKAAGMDVIAMSDAHSKPYHEEMLVDAMYLISDFQEMIDRHLASKWLPVSGAPARFCLECC